MTRHISQREARSWRKRAMKAEALLAEQRRAWASEWVGGVDIGRAGLEHLPGLASVIHTARLLRHAVVATLDGSTLRLHALPLEPKP